MASRTLKIGTEEVILDDEHLQFTEATLNEFLQKSPSWYNYYSERHSRAQFYSSVYEDRADKVYSEKFKFYKAEGGSDKLAEAAAKCDSEVVDASLKVRRAKEVQNIIYGFLRSLDKAMQNALNLGYNIRKEMDKLGRDSVKSLEEIMGTADQ